MSASEIMPSQVTSTFDLFALRLHYRAPAAVEFPAGETANLFRGQFGKVLYRRAPSLYRRFFAPVQESGVPSGLHDPPRPFVLRVRHLDGAKLQEFQVGLNVFDANIPNLAPIYDGIDEIARDIFHASAEGRHRQEALHLPLTPTRRAERVRVNFLSPTEIKHQERPEFGPMFSRIRDRISTLRALYGSGPLEIDFKAMGERAASIQMTRCEIQPVNEERVSRSTGDRHSLGGFTGVADYEGDLTEFVPYLEIAAYTGVGRQTVWGKGEISVETF
jgi:hypothetical protein